MEAPIPVALYSRGVLWRPKVVSTSTRTSDHARSSRRPEIRHERTPYTRLDGKFVTWVSREHSPPRDGKRNSHTHNTKWNIVFPSRPRTQSVSVPVYARSQIGCYIQLIYNVLYLFPDNRKTLILCILCKSNGSDSVHHQ